MSVCHFIATSPFLCIINADVKYILLGRRDEVVYGPVSFQSLFYHNKKIDAVNHFLDKFHLRESQPV